MPLCDGFVLHPSLISTTIVARSRTKVSPTIVQLHLLRGSGVIASSCPINRACSERVPQKGSQNDRNQEDAFSSWLVSHSKGSLRVYGFSSGSICALAGAVTGSGAYDACTWPESTSSDEHDQCLWRESRLLESPNPGPWSNCFASRLLMLSPSRIRTGLGRADDYESSSSQRDHHSGWECPGA